MTKPQGYWHSATEAGFCLFVLCLPHYQSVLSAEIGRTIFAVLLTCLLMFLVVRSTEICRVVTDCLLALVPRLASSFAQEFRAILFGSLTVPSAPTVSPLFQRPPPLFS